MKKNFVIDVEKIGGKIYEKISNVVTTYGWKIRK